MKLITILTLLILSVNCDPNESSLRNFLMKNDHRVRPGNNNDPLKVTVNFTPIYLSKLDDVSQTISLFGWARQTWMNPHVNWNPEHYNNITSVDFRNGEIWYPDLKIFTGYINKKDEFGIIYHNGLTVWVTAGFFNTHCSMEFSKYPVDSKVCNYIFGSWIYDTNNLKFQVGTFNKEFYRQDIHWNLESVTGVKQEVKYGCCSPTFEQVNVSFSFNHTNFVHPKNQ